jgi:hypothetical protein
MERRELASGSFLRTCTCSFLAISKPYRIPEDECLSSARSAQGATGSSFHHAPVSFCFNVPFGLITLQADLASKDHLGLVKILR